MQCRVLRCNDTEYSVLQYSEGSLACAALPIKALRMDPYTLRFVDSKLEDEFAHLRYCESGLSTLALAGLGIALAVSRWMMFPFVWPGTLIRVVHHVSICVCRYALDHYCGVRRASAIFPWVVCSLTWIGATCFVVFRCTGSLDTRYTVLGAGRMDGDCAKVPLCAGTNPASATIIMGIAGWGLQDGLIPQKGGCACVSGWPLARPFLAYLLASYTQTGKALDAEGIAPMSTVPWGSFALMAIGHWLTGFATRRIGIPFAPRLASHVAVILPLLSACSVSRWLVIFCALAAGELVNRPLEKRWRRHFLESSRPSVPPSKVGSLARSDVPTVVSDLMGNEHVLGCAGATAVALVLGIFLHGGASAAMLAVAALPVGASLYHFLNVDLRVVSRQELRRQQLEAAKELEIKTTKDTESAIAAFIFHELRNDQNAISGFLAILADDLGTAGGSVLSPNLQVLLRSARLHSHHAVQVIQNMLEMSKVRANKPTLTSEVFEVRELCNECGALVSHLLVSDAVALQIEVEPGLLPVRGSTFHVKQVLLNLLTNACKYTEAGTIVLSVARAACPPPSSAATTEATEDAAVVHLRFAVRDTGCGIEPERQRAVFAAYTQGPRVGTGLGLPLARALVNLMGGELMLYSRGTSTSGDIVNDESFPAPTAREEEGESACEGGSTFSFELALPTISCAEISTETPSAAQAATPPSAPASLRVLIADDQSINRTVLKHRLKQTLPETTFSFVECGTGEEALATLGMEPEEPADGFNCDLVFLDEHFGPGLLLGTDVTRSVRQLEQSRSGHRVVRPLLIVGCSGNTGTEEFDARARQAGQDATVGKPVPLPHDFRELLLVRLRLARQCTSK